MKIGNTVIELSDEEGLVIAIILVVTVFSLLLLMGANMDADRKIRSSVETLYCLEHTNLSADECDRLF